MMLQCCSQMTILAGANKLQHQYSNTTGPRSVTELSFTRDFIYMLRLELELMHI